MKKQTIFLTIGVVVIVIGLLFSPILDSIRNKVPTTTDWKSARLGIDQAKPDLKVHTMQFNEQTVIRGNPAYLDITVKNVGKTAITNSFTTKVYFGNITLATLPWNTQDPEEPPRRIQPGETVSWNDVQINTNLLPDNDNSYQIVAKADYNNNVRELDEFNNQEDRLLIIQEQQGYNLKAISIEFVNERNPYIIGNIQPSFRVKNDGTEDIRKPELQSYSFRYNLLATDDENPYIPLGEGEYQENLLVGQETEIIDHNLEFNTNLLTPGVLYTFYVYLDPDNELPHETNELDNSYIIKKTIGGVDYTITSVEAIPKQQLPGRDITLSTVVANIGHQAGYDPDMLVIRDYNYDNSLFNYTVNGRLDAGESVTREDTFTDRVFGIHFLEVFVDPPNNIQQGGATIPENPGNENGKVLEENENNNYVIYSYEIIASSDIEPYRLWIGNQQNLNNIMFNQPTQIHTVINNYGNLNVPQGTIIALYKDESNVPFYNSAVQRSIPAAGYVQIDIPYTETSQENEHDLTVKITPPNGVQDDPSNNEKTIHYYVHERGSDLLVSELMLESEAGENRTMVNMPAFVTIGVQNVGIEATQQSAQLALYRDNALQRTITIPDLEPGETYQITIDDYEGGELGNHQLKAIADYDNQIDELYERNNEMTIEYEVVLTRNEPIEN